MGMYIELEKCNFKTLVDKLMEDPKIDDREMLEKILKGFGEVIGDTYLLLDNEFYEEYNSYYELERLLESYFRVDCFDIIMKECREVNANQSASDVAELLGIEYNPTWDID